MLLKLAWRNLWRNKRRTYITLASVFFAVILSTLMMSIKEGIYANMIQSTIGSFTGFAQIHAKGYWEDQTLDNSMEITDSLEQILKSDESIRSYTKRIESFALAASRDQTKGSMVVGIEPEKEQEAIELASKVVEGEYLVSNDRQALVGDGLAKKLGMGVGDTIVLLGAGYRGASAAGKYRIKGIVKYGSPELSRQLVFLAMEEAQYLYNLMGLYSSINIQFEDNDKAVSNVKKLKSRVSKDYEVMDWKELAPEMNKMIETDKIEGYVFMFILYMVISFGIFGTMLMMVAERRHEFGVLVAVGMKRVKLSVMVWSEIIIISLLGSFAGMLGAFPVCLYFNLNPIRFGDEFADMYEDYGMEAVLQASIDPFVFLQQASIVAILASFIAIYPFIKILGLNAIESMRS